MRKHGGLTATSSQEPDNQQNASVLEKMDLLPREKLVGLLLLDVGIVELEALRKDFGQGQ